MAICEYGCGLPRLWNSHSLFVSVTFKNICGLFPQVGILRFQNPMGFSLNSFCLYYTLKPWQNVAFLVNVVEGKKGDLLNVIFSDKIYVMMMTSFSLTARPSFWVCLTEACSLWSYTSQTCCSGRLDPRVIKKSYCVFSLCPPGWACCWCVCDCADVRWVCVHPVCECARLRTSTCFFLFLSFCPSYFRTNVQHCSISSTASCLHPLSFFSLLLAGTTLYTLWTRILLGE